MKISSDRNKETMCGGCIYSFLTEAQKVLETTLHSGKHRRREREIRLRKVGRDKREQRGGI